MLQGAFLPLTSCAYGRIVYAVKHTRRRRAPKLVTFTEAFERSGLTQLQLEERSGVDRTRISKLMLQAAPNVTLDTYDKLDAALRACRALAPMEKLVFRMPAAREDATPAPIVRERSVS